MTDPTERTARRSGRATEHADTPQAAEARRRQTRRRQMALAIGAVLAIVAFALIQGFLGAPSKIPGTHPHQDHHHDHGMHAVDGSP